MTEHADRKTTLQCGLIEVLVGLSFAIGFYFLAVGQSKGLEICL